MRICTTCDQHINIRNQACPHCGSDLRRNGRAIDRQRRIANNKALVAVCGAMLVLLLGLGVVAQRPSKAVRSADWQDTTLTLSDCTTALRGVLKAQLTLPSQYVVLHKVTAGTQTATRFDVVVSKNDHGFDGLYDLALDLAKGSGAKTVAVRVWTKGTPLDQPLANHEFRIAKTNGKLNVEYDLN